MGTEAPYTVVYVLGTSFSGSTLVNTLLGRHPDALGLNEVANVGRELRKTAADPEYPLNHPLWRQVAERYERETRQSFQEIDLLWDAARARRATSADRTAWALRTEAFFDAVHAESGARVLVDSSKHSRRLAMLRGTALRSRIRVIELVREGTAVLASYRRRNASAARSIAGIYVHSLRSTWLRTLWPDDRWCLVRYEDFVETPRETVTRLMRFAGLDPEVDVLAPRRAEAHPVALGKKGFNLARWPTTVDPPKPVALSPRDRWLYALSGGWLRDRLHGYRG